MSKQPIIGLAGGIGSGKSAVAKALADLGCVVADADAASRAALHEPEIRRRIVEAFGEGVLHNETDEIDRSALAGIVFSDPAKRRVLESIIHPRVEQQRAETFASATPDAPALVIDAPLLFEAGLDKKCDAVIFVDAPQDVRKERVARHRGWDAGELDRREQSQMPLDEKQRLADYVICNGGSVDQLTEQVRRILSTIVRASRAGDRA